MDYLLPLLSFIICLLLTPLVRSLALQRGWQAEPSQDRWHQKPTALLGGVAIYSGFSIPLIFNQCAEIGSGHQIQNLTIAICTGTTILMLLGLLDDFIDIPPTAKLGGQIIVASMVIFLGFRLHWVTSRILDVGLTLVWIVGITNAFNLLDNMDGLCAGVGTVSALVLGILFMDSAPQAALMAFVLAGTMCAFLIYNFNPASIYMGDCGSLVIGFTLSVLCLQYSVTSVPNGLLAWGIPILIMLVPIFDTILVTIARLLNGRSVFMGGCDHTSHRLVFIGFSDRLAVLFLYGIAAVAGAAAILLNTIGWFPSPVIVILITLPIFLMGIYLIRLKVYPE